MERVKRMGIVLLLATGITLLPGLASAEDAGPCTECRQQPYGHCAGRFTCIFSPRNWWCSWDGSPCSDWCIENQGGGMCPV